ncbi:MAG: hypothetical protein ACTILH_04660, partial [Corynebacterium casei]|uniref:hypothetical protein n=1 Tax=Corynebacterium casei TaxID=160386 RepID=UPI003F962DB2
NTSAFQAEDAGSIPVIPSTLIINPDTRAASGLIFLFRLSGIPESGSGFGRLLHSLQSPDVLRS